MLIWTKKSKILWHIKVGQTLCITHKKPSGKMKNSDDFQQEKKKINAGRVVHVTL